MVTERWSEQSSLSTQGGDFRHANLSLKDSLEFVKLWIAVQDMYDRADIAGDTLDPCECNVGKSFRLFIGRDAEYDSPGLPSLEAVDGASLHAGHPAPETALSPSAFIIVHQGEDVADVFTGLGKEL